MNRVHALLLVPLLLSLPAAAEPPRLAVVDLARAFEAHPRAAAATARLTTERNAARQEFRAQSEALKKTLQEHQELIRAGKKPEAAEKLKEANDHEKAIAALRTTQQRDLEERFREEKRAILESIRDAIREHNADEGYALILDRSAESSFGLPVVIDAPGAEDITDAIIARLRESR